MQPNVSIETFKEELLDIMPPYRMFNAHVVTYTAIYKKLLEFLEEHGEEIAPHPEGFRKFHARRLIGKLYSSSAEYDIQSKKLSYELVDSYRSYNPLTSSHGEKPIVPIQTSQYDNKQSSIYNDGGSTSSTQYAHHQMRANYRHTCLLYTSPSPRDQRGSRMPSSA